VDGRKIHVSIVVRKRAASTIQLEQKFLQGGPTQEGRTEEREREKGRTNAEKVGPWGCAAKEEAKLPSNRDPEERRKKADIDKIRD